MSSQRKIKVPAFTYCERHRVQVKADGQVSPHDWHHHSNLCLSLSLSLSLPLFSSSSLSFYCWSLTSTHQSASATTRQKKGILTQGILSLEVFSCLFYSPLLSYNWADHAVHTAVASKHGSATAAIDYDWVRRKKSLTSWQPLSTERNKGNSNKWACERQCIDDVLQDQV